MNISQESSLSEDEDDDIRFKQTCHSDTDESGDEMMKGDFQLKNNRNSSEHNNSTELNKLEKEKQLVYRHSLFPLLALLLEKCEHATSTLGTKEDLKFTKESFKSDIEALITHYQKENKPLLGDNPEVDALMITAIQVLRIHLHELEKVQDLCKEFCQRYIFCLRAKMSSENLLRDASRLLNNYDSSSCSSEADECSSSSSSLPITNRLNDDFANSSVPKSFAGSLGSRNSKQKPPSKDKSRIFHAHHSSKIDSGSDGDISDEASNVSQKKNQKRGILPKQATSILRSWLFQHIVHPYPTEDEKKAIASETNLTLLQINNWFINARRRILQPMLDSANISVNNGTKSDPASFDEDEGDKEGATSPLRLTKSNPKSVSPRFWPESMSAILKVTNSMKKKSPTK